MSRFCAAPDSLGKARTSWGPRARRARQKGAALLVVLSVAVAGAPAAAEPHVSAKDEELPAVTDHALITLCGIVEASAKTEGLPVNFFTRLIWRESSFRSNAVSPAGAQGVAQFMPGTASERGLADPFDPAAAIPASAKLIADLSRQFGNLGLAAAAYNAGPNALAGWLAGTRPYLPIETQDYVRAITGHDVEEWKAAKPPAVAAPDPNQPCLVAIAKLRITRGYAGEPAIISGLFAPWGVQVSGSFSKSGAINSFRRAEQRYASVIGGIQPFVLGSAWRTRGFRPFYRVRLPAQSRGEANALCARLRKVGGACVVLRS